jgi:hypothetical protein
VVVVSIWLPSGVRSGELLVGAYLRDTLSPLATAENSPCDLTGVLALEEERLGLSALEAEDLAVRADEELAL